MIRSTEPDSPLSATNDAGLGRRVALQGTMLFAGFGVAQLLSFARNALIGHALSQTDFGIAATITLMLQLIETLSDLGSDRLIVQADDGTSDRFFATAHAILIARGFLIATTMLIAAPAIAAFFQVQHAIQAFQLAAFGPFLKGFMHLDYRAAQRRFDNRPYLWIEVVPQAAALAMTIPALAMTNDYSLVVGLTLGQAAIAVSMSHLLASRHYDVGLDFTLIKRHLAYGWPILLSAIPVIAVFQGDRIIVGRLLGMEALAVYSAAFMITMVPGLIAGKVGHSLLLPVFSDTLRNGRGIKVRYRSAVEATTVFAALYLAAFCIAGNWLLPVVFGDKYAGFGAITGWLAAMWTVRMIQSVPGMGLMAYGHTKPFLVAGILRAHALPCVLLAALTGYGLATLAAIGVVFEVVSLAYIVTQLERLEPQLGRLLFDRALFILPAGIGATLLGATFGGTPSALLWSGLIAIALIAAIGLAVMPGLRRDLRRAFVGAAPLVAA